MDSVTSGGSLQSSSGEADGFSTTAATVDSLSAIFHHFSGATAAAIPLPPSIDHHHARGFFDPISYLDSISSISPPSWPPPSSMPPPSPSPPPHLALSSPAAATFSISSPPVQPQDPVAAPGSVGPRSSKKRSRASRRAQTTVLTTDTSNFRAMVQQFTGIPSLPFDLADATASSSPFARSRFGLFRSSSSSFSPLPSPPPPLLLRPFPPKTSTGVAASPTAAYSSSSPSATTGIAAANSAINGDRNASTQSPMLTLQSLLHDMPAFCSTTNSTAETPTELGSSDLWLPAPEFMAGGDARSSSWPANGYSQSRSEICASSQQGASSCKMNYLAPGSSSPELNAEKELAAPAPAASKGEDIIDSWIFSSD